jgi:transcriptional regulator with XRE-family HTH domain
VFINFFSFGQLSHVENEEKIFIKNFGEKLKKLRLEKNLSQEMLANDANIPINQIGRIERAEISTSLTTIYKIAKALDIKITVLFDF